MPWLLRSLSCRQAIAVRNLVMFTVDVLAPAQPAAACTARGPSARAMAGEMVERAATSATIPVNRTTRFVVLLPA